jgi:hypothetical protein
MTVFCHLGNDAQRTDCPPLLRRAVIFLLILFQCGCQNITADRQTTFAAANKAVKEKHYDEAYKLLLPLAEAGDAESQFSISFFIDLILDCFPPMRLSTLLDYNI